MDLLQTTISTLAIIGIILFMILLVCHFLTPRATAWFLSNREEKISLSKMKLFNANGYLVHSGSEILLGSTGSFKRFDSVDRDYRPQAQFGQTAVSTPPWNKAPEPESDIPPQPLRPAPSPTTKTRDQKPFHERISWKQQSLENKQSTSVPLNITSIPRPVPRRQISAPISTTIPLLNPPEVKNGPHSCTNPFRTTAVKVEVLNEKDNSNNPFLEDREENIFDFEPSHIKSIMEEEDPLKQVEARITKLEAFRKMSESNEVLLDIAQRLKLNENKSNNHQNEPNISTAASNSPSKVLKSGNFSDKYSDSPKTDVIDNVNPPTVSKGIKKMLRNRSHSETEASLTQHLVASLENEAKNLVEIANTSQNDLSSTNPFQNDISDNRHTTLHKTVSETFLEQYNISKMESGRMFGGKCLVRQESQSSIDSESSGIISLPSKQITRAGSSESVSSQSSVVLSDLEQLKPPVTGQLCIGLQYDRNSATQDGCELILTVQEAKDLVGPNDADRMDTFVRIYLVPDENGALQTKLFKNSPCPSYQETFSFWITKKNIRRSLWFHLYHTSSRAHTLIGETEMQLKEIHRPITTWLTLSDSKYKHCAWGEIMFSLSYLPTAERLTVVVVKARNLSLTPQNTRCVRRNSKKNKNDLNGPRRDEIENVFVKVYLLKNNKKVSKKKTSMKRGEASPIFNESMMFSVPPFMLNSVQVRLTVMNMQNEIVNGGNSMKMTPIGHIIVGSGTSGKALRHWHQMLTTLRKPTAMWHALRTTNSNIKKQNGHDHYHYHYNRY